MNKSYIVIMDRRIEFDSKWSRESNEKSNFGYGLVVGL